MHTKIKKSLAEICHQQTKGNFLHEHNEIKLAEEVQKLKSISACCLLEQTHELDMHMAQHAVPYCVRE
jgi:hypothetical protein